MEVVYLMVEKNSTLLIIWGLQKASTFLVHHWDNNIISSIFVMNESLMGSFWWFGWHHAGSINQTSADFPFWPISQVILIQEYLPLRRIFFVNLCTIIVPVTQWSMRRVGLVMRWSWVQYLAGIWHAMPRFEFCPRNNTS